MAAGVLPLVVALGALGLMWAQFLQLRKLREHLNNPEMSSDEYRAACRKTFWKMVNKIKFSKTLNILRT